MSQGEQRQFRRDVVGADLQVCVGRWVLERIPFIFQENADAYSQWRHRMARGLDVDACDIALTGSAAAGFSLSPYKSLKPFDEDSDIDVAIVSPYHFDVAWRYLRGLGSDLYKLTPAEQLSVADHRKRLIYWGTVATDRFLARLPFGARWLSVLSDVSGEFPALGREINARLYRDFSALRAYQTDGLRKLRESILNEGVET